MSNSVDQNHILLRNLDDIDCSNVVVSRQIRKLAKKFPSLNETEIDCWISCGNAIKFIQKNGKFLWELPNNFISQDDEELSRYELNKLLVFTFRTMCDMNEADDLSDTPEDLLAYAEMKLREMLADEAV